MCYVTFVCVLQPNKANIQAEEQAEEQAKEQALATRASSSKQATATSTGASSSAQATATAGATPLQGVQAEDPRPAVTVISDDWMDIFLAKKEARKLEAMPEDSLPSCESE